MRCVLLAHAQKIQHMGPAIDFYKKLALDCSAQQVAVDLFMLNSQYADLASICKCSTCSTQTSPVSVSAQSTVRRPRLYLYTINVQLAVRRPRLHL